MKLSKLIFLIAGTFGLFTTIPLVFAEKMMSVKQPEFYYGFVFLDICLQVVYIIISTSPGRFRPMMIPAILAKASAAIVLTWLYLIDQVSLQWIAIGAIDGVFAILFLMAFFSTSKVYEK